MPRFWDLASFVGNAALFYGLKHPLVDHVMKDPFVREYGPAFRFALESRAIMATVTNLSMALEGHGDIDFACRQLTCIFDFLRVLHQN